MQVISERVRAVSASSMPVVSHGCDILRSTLPLDSVNAGAVPSHRSEGALVGDFAVTFCFAIAPDASHCSRKVRIAALVRAQMHTNFKLVARVIALVFKRTILGHRFRERNARIPAQVQIFAFILAFVAGPALSRATPVNAFVSTFVYLPLRAEEALLVLCEHLLARAREAVLVGCVIEEIIGTRVARLRFLDIATSLGQLAQLAVSGGLNVKVWRYAIFWLYDWRGLLWITLATIL